MTHLSVSTLNPSSLCLDASLRPNALHVSAFLFVSMPTLFHFIARRVSSSRSALCLGVPLRPDVHPFFVSRCVSSSRCPPFLRVSVCLFVPMLTLSSCLSVPLSPDAHICFSIFVAPLLPRRQQVGRVRVDGPAAGRPRCALRHPQHHYAPRPRSWHH